MTRPIDDHWMDHDDCREPERAVIKVTGKLIGIAVSLFIFAVFAVVWGI